jgi:hypothetical protein
MKTKHATRSIEGVRARPCKVIPIREAAPAPVVSQRDVIELDWLTKNAKEAIKLRNDKRAEIRKLLEAGAVVEDGLRTARLRTVKQMVTTR